MTMATRQGTPPPAHNIIDIDVGEEMRGSFLEYAYSVIYARALPDARDGLKPVQRRIMYQAGEMGLRPDRGHVKSARVVGEVMGRLHPHGESAIYDALVRMAQPFSMRLPLIDGHGNFGSLDDGPAAMRYTECRLAEPALAMIESVHENTVDFVANYDGREHEPIVLPAAVPALLVNGATGIAVGMATNIPPHNLTEVVAAARHLLAHPQASTTELMRFVPGPDLPTGGKIIGLAGIRDAYVTGRGAFKMRAKVSVTQLTPRRRGLVVTELPYNVGVEKVMQKIKDLHKDKKITGISGMNDLTDGDQGLNLVIEVKSGIDPEALLAQLYKLTPLEEQFNINAVALVDGVPKTLGLAEMLQVFLDHRLEVVRRRSEFRKQKAAERLHLVDGLLIAIVDIDEVIAVIRSSDDAASARVRLIEIFELSEAQANYILDMPLRRLTKFSKLELIKEQQELQATIAELNEILTNDQVRRDLVGSELATIAEKFGTPRRTLLTEATEPAQVGAQLTLEMANEPCLVALSSTHRIAQLPRIAPEDLDFSAKSSPDDALVSVVTATTRGDVGAVTNTGRVLRIPVVELPGLPPTAQSPSLTGGTEIGHYVSITPAETVIALVPLDGSELALGTRQGMLKRVNGEIPQSADSWQIVNLEPGDELIGISAVTDADQLVFISEDAQLLHFSAALVKAKGRAAGTIAGIKMGSGKAVGFAVVSGAADLSQALVVTVAGANKPTSVKVTPLSEFPTKGRGTTGVRCMRLRTDEKKLKLAGVFSHPKAATAAGRPVPLPPVDLRRDGTGTTIVSTVAAIGSALEWRSLGG